MRQALWDQQPPPAQRGLLGEWQLTGLAHFCFVRHRLREFLPGTAPRGPTAEEDVERMLLTVEELASNRLRHGRSPVRVRVVGLSDGWLIDVTDAATDTAPDRPPAPAVDCVPPAVGWACTWSPTYVRRPAGPPTAATSTSRHGCASTCPDLAPPSPTCHSRPARSPRRAVRLARTDHCSLYPLGCAALARR